MITTFYPPYNFGGDGIFVHQLSNELARQGHFIDVIHCIDAYQFLAGREPATAYDNHPNVTVHGLKSPFGFLSPLATQQTGFPLFKSTRIETILAKGFDVIHYHNISLIGGPKILEYGKAIKLYTMHEYWLVCPTHVLFKFNREVCTRRHCFTCGLTYNRPPQWWRHSGMMQSATQHVDAFIAPSQFSRDLHIREGLKAPVVHLPNFVSAAGDAAPLPLRGKAIPSKKPYFLFVGRLEKIKGLQTILSVFQQYKKADLWIAGTGTYETHLRQLAKCGDNIRFLGNKAKKELQLLYRDATALVVPSLSFEVFPLVVLEAFVQQTPAIVRNIGGLPEIIKDSGGGFVYNNEEELVAAMDSLVENAQRRDELGLKGYNAYRKNWTPEAHLTRYFELIDKIESDPRRNSH
jgi:glycosyltransferase involved in cell wall biosynthesis